MKITKSTQNRVAELNSLIGQANRIGDQMVELRDNSTWPTVYEFISIKANKFSISFSYYECYKSNKLINEKVGNEEDAKYYLSLYKKSLKYYLKHN